MEGLGSWGVDFWRNVLLITLFILLAVVFYRWLLRYLRRKQIQKKFAFLHPLKSESVSGKPEKLRLELPYKSSVICICANGSDRVLIFEGDLEAGTHDLEWDVSGLSDGPCELEVKLPDQKITRRIEVVS